MRRPLARLFAWLSSFPTGWLVLVARHGARLPAGSLGWPAGLRGGLLLAAASAGLLAVAGRPRLRRPLAALTAGATLSAVGVASAAPAWPPPGWSMVVCDVGQGDGMVGSVGTGTAAVIDTGPDPGSIDRCLRALGVRRIPLLLLTHLHADHVEGVPGVLRGRVVDEAQTGPLDDPPDEHARVTGWLAAAGVALHRVSVGEQRSFGTADWTVLGPSAAFHGRPSDPNNSSVVLRLSLRGFTVLATGDVEWQAQRALLSAGTDVRADVLKVPHHVSDHQDPGFLDSVGAALAVTSVGRGNSYGHPSPVTLDRVRADGMRSYRTDDNGDVALVAGPRGITATARRGRGTPAAGPDNATPDQRLRASSSCGPAHRAGGQIAGSALGFVPAAGSGVAHPATQDRSARSGGGRAIRSTAAGGLSRLAADPGGAARAPPVPGRARPAVTTPRPADMGRLLPWSTPTC